MGKLHWDPICDRPDHLVRPVRLDPSGRAGPTRGQARGPSWDRVASGLYVPTDGHPDCVEQRILEQGTRLAPDGSRGVVTGWANLRWRGAAFFDGLGPGGVGRLPVELATCVVDGHLRPGKGSIVNRRALSRRDRTVVDGLPLATVQRALFDEIFRRGDLWTAVEAIDMAAAALLISAWYFAWYLGDCNACNGVPLARDAVVLAVDESRSPRETWLRLVWVLLAGLPPPLVNQPVYDLAGSKIGTPDLFDPEAGFVGEYFGQDHKGIEAHRHDVEREDAFRDHQIEYVAIVRGESRETVARRLLAARGRARFLAPESRSWTVEPPAWVPHVETLDERIRRLGLVESLTCYYPGPPPARPRQRRRLSSQVR